MQLQHQSQSILSPKRTSQIKNSLNTPLHSENTNHPPSNESNLPHTTHLLSPEQQSFWYLYQQQDDQREPQLHLQKEKEEKCKREKLKGFLGNLKNLPKLQQMEMLNHQTEANKNLSNNAFFFIQSISNPRSNCKQRFWWWRRVWWWWWCKHKEKKEWKEKRKGKEETWWWWIMAVVLVLFTFAFQ